MIYSRFVLEMLLPQTTAPLYVPLGNLPPIGDPMFKLEVGREKRSSDWRVELAGVGSDELLCTGLDST